MDVYNNTPSQYAPSLQQISSDEIHIMASSHPSFINQNGSVAVSEKVSLKMTDSFSRIWIFSDAGDIRQNCRESLLHVFLFKIVVKCFWTDYLLSDSFRGPENEISQCPIGGGFLWMIYIERLDQITACYRFFPQMVFLERIFLYKYVTPRLRIVNSLRFKVVLPCSSNIIVNIKWLCCVVCEHRVNNVW